MDNNLITIEKTLDYIEKHLLDEMLDLNVISKEIGYSKYHYIECLHQLSDLVYIIIYKDVD
ncbi:hypothetical protein [Clostridioides difficile]|uniref:hypothetical protein n=1 Tax=Clostridioides difficile TaxID=1496 RepID=UPI002FD5B728